MNFVSGHEVLLLSVVYYRVCRADPDLLIDDESLASCKQFLLFTINTYTQVRARR